MPTANDLDPYLVAALVAQESTFVADIRSPANAYGLMQLLPSTARRWRGSCSLPYSSRLLTDPGAEHPARDGVLRRQGQASSATCTWRWPATTPGERAVRRWMNERPGLEREEFIDDIPYPETQNYVKRILGTAEDYRRLYGNVGTAGYRDDARSPRRPAISAPRSKPQPARKPASSSKKSGRCRQSQLEAA